VLRYFQNCRAQVVPLRSCDQWEILVCQLKINIASFVVWPGGTTIFSNTMLTCCTNTISARANRRSRKLWLSRSLKRDVLT